MRRIIDKKKGTVSLWRLLEDMKKHTHNLTRDWYISMHEGSIKKFAIKWFDKLVDNGSNHVSRRMIKLKQESLTKAVSLILTYSNTSVAHLSKNTVRVTLKFEDVRKSIASVFVIFNWCSSLLTSSIIITPVPFSQGNWLQVFKRPWLVKKTDSPIPSTR